MQIAARHAGGRVVSVLEGGYNLDGLASAAARTWRHCAARPAGRQTKPPHSRFVVFQSTGKLNVRFSDESRRAPCQQ